MLELLPYRDNTRQCQPVKCVAFFNYADPKKVAVKIIFTDQEETIGPKDEAAPEWLVEVTPDQKSQVIANLKNVLTTFCYQVTERAAHPTDYISFDLQPLPEKPPET